MTEPPDDFLGPAMLERLVAEAVGEILRHESFDRLRMLVRDRLRDALPPAPEQFRDALVTHLSLSLWRATPLPSRGFRLPPNVAPGRNEPCVCGSGRKYKRCCGALELPEDIVPVGMDDLWPIVVQMLPKDALKGVPTARLPVEAITGLAERRMEEGRPKAALELLEPMFAGDLDQLGGRHEPALDLLCNLYDRLGREKRKRALLEKTATSARPPLRCAAHMQLATIAEDRHDHDAAWRQFERACKVDPRHPALGPLEVTLLMSRGERDRAMARAEYWRGRLRRQEGAGHPLVELLTEMATTPELAMLLDTGSTLDEAERRRLWSLVERAKTRPLPDYRVKVGVGGSELTPPTAIPRVERSWREVPSPDPWADGPSSAQLRFLEKDPDALDSLEVLNDLVTQLHLWPAASTPWHRVGLLLPLARRGHAIVREAWSRGGAGEPRLPALADSPRRRAALELLAAASEAYGQESDDPIPVYRLMLELDPSDELQVIPRTAIAHASNGDFGEVLALARAHQGPVPFALAYTQALAQLALGDRKGARDSVEAAYRGDPLVMDYLTGRKKARPRPSGRAPTKAELAWAEAGLIRGSWQSVEGALDWLRRTRAKIDRQDRKLPRRAPREAPGICQLKIELLDIEPTIWRRIQLRYDSNFWDLHVAIQNAMGWTDSHLHAFTVKLAASGKEIDIGIPDPDGELATLPGWELPIAPFLNLELPAVLYEYDFGDCWRHAVFLESLLPEEPKATYPRCLGGERACPPEDVGGVGGYEELVAALSDPAHPERETYAEWLGGEIDQLDLDSFDPGSVQFENPERRWAQVFRR